MTDTQSPTFLGFDLSTQSLKAIILSPGFNIVHEQAVTFDKDLPHYQTTGGAIRGKDGEVTSPVAMWLEAFDLVLSRMKDAGVNFGRVRGVSGAGQVRGDSFGGRCADVLSIATWIGILVEGRNLDS